MVRNQLLDSLRGFSMIVIIFTHTTAFFPNDKLAAGLWNWSNFAVPIFIFCSVYLFFKKSLDKPVPIFPYLKKRLLRLLIPYYIFLPFFLLLLSLIASPLLSLTYIWQSILVLGGVDINWLVLLFIYITVLSPFFVWSLKRSPFIFWTFFTISLCSSVFLLFNQLTIPYKFIMWIPWALMLYVTWFYLLFEQKKKILFWFFVVSCLLFIGSFTVLNSIDKSTILIHNKYPPNMLYISYGVAVLLGLTFIEKYIFNQKVVLQMVNFFSKNSYSLYFIHYLILTFFAEFIVSLHLNWITLFLSVLIVSVLVQQLIMWARLKLRKVWGVFILRDA